MYSAASPSSRVRRRSPAIRFGRPSLPRRQRPIRRLAIRLRLLIFGGSQGARIMADVVPAAIGLLAPALRARLTIVQQARDEDLDRVRDAYGSLSVAAEVAAFFRRSAGAHGGEPSDRCAIWSLDRRRAVGDRPARDPRAAAARARSGPVRQCRRACKAPAAPFGWRKSILRRGGSPTKSRHSRRRRSGLPPWRRRRGLWRRLDAAERLAALVLKVAAPGATK